jgi:hypothetical protein
MKSLQLHLTGAARSWLSKLERGTIGSWEELTKKFTSNFKSTYKRPALIEEVKACIQQHNETLRSYIQRWSIIKNSAVEVSDERAIDTFTLGLRRGDQVKEMGRIKPKTLSDLMDIANKFAEGKVAQFYQVFKVVCLQKNSRPIFMQLLAVYHAKKQHLEKIFTCRTMQSAIRLFVFDFS